MVHRFRLHRTRDPTQRRKQFMPMPVPLYSSRRLVGTRSRSCLRLAVPSWLNSAVNSGLAGVCFAQIVQLKAPLFCSMTVLRLLKVSQSLFVEAIHSAFLCALDSASSMLSATFLLRSSRSAGGMFCPFRAAGAIFASELSGSSQRKFWVSSPNKSIRCHNSRPALSSAEVVLLS